MFRRAVLEALEDLGDLHRAAVGLQPVVGRPDDPELAPALQALADHRLVALLEDVQRHELVGQGDDARAGRAGSPVVARPWADCRLSRAAAVRRISRTWSTTAIVWFRRDLRLHDHPALIAALRRARARRSRSSSSTTRSCTGATRARRGRASCSAACARSTRRCASAAPGWWCATARRSDEVVAVARETGARTRSCGPATSRPTRAGATARVTEALRDAGVEAQPHGGGYLVDPSRPRTQGGKPYTVFTPFWRAIADVERRPVHRAPTTLPPLPSSLRKGRIPSAAALDIDDADGPRAGRRARRGRGPRRAGALAARPASTTTPTATTRSRTAGTSVLSPYLRWGCLSARECEERAQRHGGAGAAAFVRQLAWRDFYAHQLLMYPDNVAQEFQERYRGACAGPTTPRRWRPGRRGRPAIRSSTPACASSRGPAGCTTARGWSSARS